MRYRLPEKGIRLYPEDWEVEIVRPKTPQDLPPSIKGVLYPPLYEDDEPVYAYWRNLRKQDDTAPKPLHPPADDINSRIFGEIDPSDYQPKNDEMASFYATLYAKDEGANDEEKTEAVNNDKTGNQEHGSQPSKRTIWRKRNRFLP